MHLKYCNLHSFSFNFSQISHNILLIKGNIWRISQILTTFSIGSYNKAEPAERLELLPSEERIWIQAHQPLLLTILVSFHYRHHSLWQMKYFFPHPHQIFTQILCSLIWVSIMSALFLTKFSDASSPHFWPRPTLPPFVPLSRWTMYLFFLPHHGLQIEWRPTQLRGLSANKSW